MRKEFLIVDCHGSMVADRQRGIFTLWLDEAKYYTHEEAVKACGYVLQKCGFMVMHVDSVKKRAYTKR